MRARNLLGQDEPLTDRIILSVPPADWLRLRKAWRAVRFRRAHPEAAAPARYREQHHALARAAGEVVEDAKDMHGYVARLEAELVKAKALLVQREQLLDKTMDRIEQQIGAFGAE